MIFSAFLLPARVCSLLPLSTSMWARQPRTASDTQADAHWSPSALAILLGVSIHQVCPHRAFVLLLALPLSTLSFAEESLLGDSSLDTCPAFHVPIYQIGYAFCFLFYSEGRQPGFQPAGAPVSPTIQRGDTDPQLPRLP